MADTQANETCNYVFTLICRKCGESKRVRLSQFDSLPNCPKCDSEMLAELAEPSDAG